MMKNAFYFTLKALFILKIFKFLSWLFGHVEERLDYEEKVNFEMYSFTTWLTPGKDHQTMKFSQLIEYCIRNIFLGNSYKQCSAEAIPRSFSKKNLSIYLDQQFCLLEKKNIIVHSSRQLRVFNYWSQTNKGFQLLVPMVLQRNPKRIN